ncbi:MAG: hypothetical protein P1U32_04200 [Legionellaceae bacterium]|nr:hypothetical protein [Legionellaceae bacterium]
MKQLLLIVLLLVNMPVYAGTAGASEPERLPWHFYATMGYVNYEDMVDKNVAIERIAGSRDFGCYRDATFGIEVGVQTGLNSRLLTTQDKLDVVGGPAIQAVISTFFDVLGTLSVPLHVLPILHKTGTPYAKPVMDFIEHTDVFAKVGMAYRQMHFDRNTINPKVSINPEVQVGLSKSLSHHASVAFAYQGIYGRGVGLTVNGTNPLFGVGAVKGIPTQNGGLVIFAWNAA